MAYDMPSVIVILFFSLMNILILANGEPPSQKMFEHMTDWADVFIAADGGGNAAQTLGKMPDIVIGDMDSYRSHEHEPYKIIRDPDQYSNDLEKALTLAQKKGATSVRVLGATGRRLDHTLKNLSVLKQFNNHFQEITFYDNEVIILLLPNQYSEEITPGTAVSLFPLSGKVIGVTTSGLKYPLTDGVLENGVQDGSSNTVVSSPVQISHRKGDLLLFIAK